MGKHPIGKLPAQSIQCDFLPSNAPTIFSYFCLIIPQTQSQSLNIYMHSNRYTQIIVCVYSTLSVGLFTFLSSRFSTTTPRSGQCTTVSQRVKPNNNAISSPNRQINKIQNRDIIMHEIGV